MLRVSAHRLRHLRLSCRFVSEEQPHGPGNLLIAGLRPGVARQEDSGPAHVGLGTVVGGHQVAKLLLLGGLRVNDVLLPSALHFRLIRVGEKKTPLI